MAKFLQVSVVGVQCGSAILICDARVGDVVRHVEAVHWRRLEEIREFYRLQWVCS
jgi:hypothetical protein